MTTNKWPTMDERYEPIRPQPCTDLPLWAEQTPGTVARDAVLHGFEDHRPAVVTALRDEARRLWAARHAPLSANDVRHVLARWPGVDPRILVTAFRGWKVVGETTHNAPGNHARRIYLYEPRVTT